jgi:hypothetical protein
LSRLDSIIARARQLDVKPEHARVYVADLDRWARRESVVPPRRWPAFVAGFGVAAALAAIAFWLFRPDPAQPTTIAINLPLPIASVATSDAAVADAALEPLPAPPVDASPAPGPRHPVREQVPPHDAEVPLPAPPSDAGSSANEHWHSARLLRSQGKFAEAVIECEAIADTHDATWAPIALVEAARIELGPLAAPERAIGYADRFQREWASNGLLPEARDLRCRALGQLGRASECDSPSPRPPASPR